MDLKKIASKAELKEYLNVHPTVKDSLVSDLLHKCKSLNYSDEEILNLAKKYRYFNKFEMVVRALQEEDKEKLFELVLTDAITNKKVDQLAFIDKVYLNREDEILRRFFSQELTLADLFDCIILCDKLSGIRSKAIDQIKDLDLDPKVLLRVLNSLHLVLYNCGMFLAEVWPDYIEEKYICNVVFEDVEKNDKVLLRLRDYFIKEFITVSKKGKIEYLHFFDLIGEDDLETLRSVDTDSTYIEWAKLEIKVRDAIPVSTAESFNWIRYMELQDKMTSFISTDELIRGLLESENSWEYECWFYALKVRVHLINLGFEFGNLDFKQLLNEPLMAFYIKSLHDLNIVESIPKMAEVIDWPSFESAKRYLNKFDATWNDQSPLTQQGYRVGMSSKLSKKDRQMRLIDIFKNVSMNQLDKKTWGIKGSPQRLEKIARHMSDQIKISRRARHRNMRVAIAHWMEDLSFLKKEFYDGKFADDFIWPNLY